MTTNQDSMAQSKLEEFFNTALQEIYWSEQHLVNVLDTMTGHATDPSLKMAFQQHKEETAVHLQRLEQVFELLEMPAAAKTSRGLQGIFDEGWQVIDETDAQSAQRDVALIIAAQKVEHYEIACYGSLRTLARTLGRKDVAKLLRQTLEEEKDTDQKLTDIAESGINEDASNEPAESLTTDSATSIMEEPDVVASTPRPVVL